MNSCIKCVFGNIASHSSVVSSLKLACAAPAYNLAIAVMVSLQECFTNVSVGVHEFEYFDIRIFDSTPRIVPQGADSVTISGSGFLKSNLVCKFAESMSNLCVISWLSSSSVACSVPEYIISQQAQIELSNNGGVDFTATFVCKLLKVVTILELKPSMGTSAANGFALTVLGVYFEESNSWFCRFGKARFVGMLVSSTSIICPVRNFAPGNVSVELGNGRGEFSSNSMKFESLRLKTASLVPSFGPSSGGTFHRIEVKDKVTFSNDIRCVIGKQVLQHVIMNLSVYCKTHQHQPGLVNFLMYDSKDNIFAKTLFEFIEDSRMHETGIKITEIRPSEGYNLGGTRVTLFVSNAGSTIPLCRFKSHNPKDSVAQSLSSMVSFSVMLMVNSQNFSEYSSFILS